VRLSEAEVDDVYHDRCSNTDVRVDMSAYHVTITSVPIQFDRMLIVAYLIRELEAYSGCIAFREQKVEMYVKKRMRGAAG
jgi:hypothetical protein